MLSERLHHQHKGGVLAGLNIYSDAPDAFDPSAVGVGLILATHGAVVISEILATNRAGNLSRALQGNREIGVAMGILMLQHRCALGTAGAVRFAGRGRGSVRGRPACPAGIHHRRAR